MKILNQLYNQALIAWQELLWFLLIPVFKLLWLGTTPLALINHDQYQQTNERLIVWLNLIIQRRSTHLFRVREASKDLETYWATFDGRREDLSLYGEALKDPEWFRGANILDVGCGVGRKSYELAKAGATQVVGVDTSKRNITVAKKMPQSNKHLEFRNVSASELTNEFPSHFDYIISFTVFEHANDVQKLLNELFVLQKPGGKNIIVYNHYLDRYGSHLKEFIYFPWPQLIWPEQILFNFWNKQLTAAHQRGEMGYFPNGYHHGIDDHNNDCFMNLNKHSIRDFEHLITKTEYKLEREFRYSKSPLLKQWPWLNHTFLAKYLEGSIVYVLNRPQ